MNTQGQVLTGSFAQNFVTTVLPQISETADDIQESGGNRILTTKQVPDDGGMNPRVSSVRRPVPPSSTAATGKRRPPPSFSPSAKVSIDEIAKQQRDNQRTGGLLSANFGTEFSSFSYLPGSNDLKETFSDFEYINRGGDGASQSRPVQQSSKSRDIDAKLEAMQKARSRDMKLAGRR